jgi:hypothetical protein
MPKGDWIASGQFFKAIGKPQGNSQIKLIPAGKISYWLGVMNNPRNEAISQ